MLRSMWRGLETWRGSPSAGAPVLDPTSTAVVDIQRTVVVCGRATTGTISAPRPATRPVRHGKPGPARPGVPAPTGKRGRTSGHARATAVSGTCSFYLFLIGGFDRGLPHPQ